MGLRVSCCAARPDVWEEYVCILLPEHLGLWVSTQPVPLVWSSHHQLCLGDLEDITLISVELVRLGVSGLP